MSNPKTNKPGRCPAHHRPSCALCGKCSHCELSIDAAGRRTQTFYKLLKNNYCPQCSRKLLDNGYVWSDYYNDYVLQAGAPEPTDELRDIRSKKQPVQLNMFEPRNKPPSTKSRRKRN